MVVESEACPKEKKSPCIFTMLIFPTEQMQRLKEKTRIIFPLFIVTLITLLGIILSIQGIDLIENDPDLLQMTEAELAIFLLITQVISSLVGMMTPVTTIFIVTIIYFIIAKLVKSPVAFRTLFAMNTFLFIVSAIQILINGIGIVLFGEIHGDWTVFTSVNIFFGQTGMLGALLTSLDVFTIWGYVLLWKGLRIIAQFSVRTTTIILVISYLFNILSFLILPS